MMVAPGERQTNKAMVDLSDGPHEEETETIFSIADVITVGRPLADLEEARAAARYLNNTLAFVEYGVADKTSYSNGVERIEPIMEGLGEIMKCCRLVSLRVEQFLDLQEERK